MYTHWPNRTRVITEQNSSGVSIDLLHPEKATPADIHEWLYAAGWVCNGNDPDDRGGLYQNHEKVKESHWMEWYEAVAYEYFWMMTIGGLK